MMQAGWCWLGPSSSSSTEENQRQRRGPLRPRSRAKPGPPTGNRFLARCNCDKPGAARPRIAMGSVTDGIIIFDASHGHKVETPCIKGLVTFQYRLFPAVSVAKAKAKKIPPTTHWPGIKVSNTSAKRLEGLPTCPKLRDSFPLPWVSLFFSCNITTCLLLSPAQTYLINNLAGSHSQRSDPTLGNT